MYLNACVLQVVIIITSFCVILLLLNPNMHYYSLQDYPQQTGRPIRSDHHHHHNQHRLFIKVYLLRGQEKEGFSS